MKRAMSMTVSLTTKELSKIDHITDEKDINVSEAVRWCINLSYARMMELGALGAQSILKQEKLGSTASANEEINIMDQLKPIKA